MRLSMEYSGRVCTRGVAEDACKRLVDVGCMLRHCTSAEAATRVHPVFVYISTFSLSTDVTSTLDISPPAH